MSAATVLHGIVEFSSVFSKLSNEELADEIVTTIWIHFPIGQRESELLSAVIERLREVKG